MNALQQLNTVC